MSDTIAVVQARVGSTRLPGKVMYPLDGEPVVSHVIQRAQAAERVDRVVLATTEKSRDDVLVHCASSIGVEVVRGPEANVLRRFANVVDRFDPLHIVRVSSDNPLHAPEVIDYALGVIENNNVDYTSAGMSRTFPLGTTSEAFTAASFEQVLNKSTNQRHQEHVTPYYREHPETFELQNITSEEVFSEARMQDRTDLRLTLDEPADYKLLETVYREVKFDDYLPLRDAIRYIDETGLGEINQHVEQKTV